jgi:hypothetical protein
MRRLSTNEAKAGHLMAFDRYRDGECSDTIEDAVARWLIGRGWPEKAASRRAGEIVQRAVADVDGFTANTP